MATVVWYGFQYSSSSDQQKPLTSLRLKLLAPQKPADDLRASTFLPSSFSVNTDNVTLQKPYTGREGKKDCFAPLTPSLFKLSEKSLEMCTENLGSETGSDVISDDAHIYYPSSFISSSSRPTIRNNTRQQSLGVRKVNSTGHSSFPPPLTTMRGDERVVVRSHREEGRLVMDAVKCPSTRSNFIIDRTQGRLRITLLRTVHDSDDNIRQFEVANQTHHTTTSTLVNNDNQFRQGNYGESSSSSLELDIINIRHNEHHIREHDVNESSGRFQRQLPAFMETGEHLQLYHHCHHSTELVNLRHWVATS